MTILTVTARRQVTLSKEDLRHLGVRPGEQIALEKLPGGRIEVRAARPAGPLSDVFDVLKAPCRPRMSIAEIGRIAADGWADRE
jgi:bifunctional DNA-binding transcriptional regulator/antitoxin component of YhaV-PrlF toxin-antitoxin module